MSKMFSIVELTAEDGSSTQFFASGMPQDKDDIFNLDEAADFFDGISIEQCVTVEIRTYVYGSGETEPADNPETISRNFERMNLLEMLDCISENTISIYLAKDFFDSLDEPLEEEEDCEI